ncbi:MAG: ribbon-helix-helix protein, CopG family [Acidilobaceae archaeon]|nr:ribbon-helix-helix protein, CopG family [Acidilobaceae archaeon]
MRVVSFKAEEELVELLEELSRKKNVAKSEIIRRALRNYISKSLEEEKPVETKRIRIIT